jgi:uncharacterized membrane protein
MSLILVVAAVVGAVDFLIDRLFGLSSSPRSMAVIALFFVAVAAVKYFTKTDPRVLTGGALFCGTYAAALLLGWTDDLPGRMIFILIFLVLALVFRAIGRIARGLRKDEP